MTTPTPDPLALAGQIQRERDSFIPGTALLRAWSQRHPAVVRLAEVVHAVERCGASTALTDVVVLCEVLRQTIHDALDQRDALAAALRAAHEENKRLVTQAAELGKWRDAVLNAAVVDWTYRKEHETDPVRAVNDLVCYALDVERDALRKENQRLREALERIRDGAGSNTVCGNDYTDRRAHTFGGIYRIAADVVGERSLDALAGGKGDL